MQALFEKTDSETYPLLDYVNSFLDPENNSFDTIQLPPIQRNAVWNTAQIERLWDSLLQGFPIGSFLLAPRREGDSARSIFNGIQKTSGNDGFFLLDGQQRTRALILGFQPTEGARLWIDLQPNMPFKNFEHNDRKFLLRLITSYQPWGMKDQVPSEKLHEHQKYEARNELFGSSVRYDYQVKINTGYQNDLEQLTSWPIMASLPIPLDALIKLCGFTGGQFQEPSWSDVLALVPEKFSLVGLPEEPTQHYKQIINALKPLLDAKSQTARVRKVVLLYQNNILAESDESLIDPMEVLFTRVNAGGTELNGEEMAYSLLKSSWDGAYNMVSKIVASEKVGYLLPPTGIVMAATRLARCIMEKNDDPNPSISSFRRWIRDPSNGPAFLDQMKALLETSQGESVFYNILENFCDLILYKEHLVNDIGLPKKLLLSIKPVFWHPLFIWINLNQEDKELLQKNRKRLIRYLMLSFITVQGSANANKASKIAVSLVKECNGKDFPDEKIHQSLVEAELSVLFPNLQEFSEFFKTDCDGFLRHDEELFGKQDDQFYAFRYLFWRNQELLLWFQREYASKWFVGYNPFSNDAYDTPYDYDHILPYSHLINSGQNNDLGSEDHELTNKFHRNRHLYINSIGNFRIWPLWANRSDQNKCHSKKLRLKEFDLSNDPVASELLLSTNQDFLMASAINPLDKDVWLEAGGSPRQWPQSRRFAFQSAVETRVIGLYRTFYGAFFEINPN